ncbi:MAG: hypothetical protein ACO1Q7_07285 [Gemmatimonas sp.]
MRLINLNGECFVIVWSTEFPIPIGVRHDEVMAVASRWLKGSPHHPWKDVVLHPIADGEAAQNDHEGQIVRRARVALIDEELSGFRHTWIEQGLREWTTELVCRSTKSSATIAVRLDCNQLVAGAYLPSSKKPILVKMLLQQFGGGVDSWLEVQDRPTKLREVQVDDAAAIVRGSTPVCLPIVYVTAGSSHLPQVDADELARWLGGVAHVVVEPSRHFSLALARNVNRANPYGGAVAVFWPRSADRHIRFLQRDFSSATELASAVADRVRDALTAVRPTTELTWSYLQEQVARHRFETLKKTGSTELEDYVKAFDDEQSAKDERIASDKREIGRLQAEVRRLEAATDAAAGLLGKGQEPELYPGEIRDAVLFALRLGLMSLEVEGRRSHIVSDLLETNSPTGTDEAMAESVKKCFASSGELTTANRRTLEDLGFEIAVDGRHHRASYRGDGRYSFTISKTSSDHRAGKNLASEINRKLFK